MDAGVDDSDLYGAPAKRRLKRHGAVELPRPRAGSRYAGRLRDQWWGRRVARGLVLAVCAMVFLAGCANDPVLPIATWTLDAPGVSSPITVPAHFGDRLRPGPTRYTLRAHVALTNDFRGRDLTLAIPQLFAITTLEVDGHPLDALDTEDVDRYRSVGPHRWRIPAAMTAGGEIDLALDVEHAWTQSAWLDTVPRLSATPRGDRTFLIIRAFNATTAFAATTTLLMSAFVYGVVFLIDRRRRAYGWFALHAMGAFYPMFQLGFMQAWIGSGDVVALGVFVVLGNVSAVYFTHAQFDLGPPNRVWLAACAITIALAVFTSGPFQSTRTMGPAAMLVTISNVLYQIFFFSRRLVRQRKVPLHTLAILISWTLLAGSALADFGWWFGWGELWGGLHGAHLGIAGIAVLQSAALAHEHTRSLQTSDALNVELAGRVDLLEQRNVEVDHLNDELRRQIAARSQQLSELLARDAGRTGATAVRMAAGFVVGSRYRIVRAIGEGGMGAVYEVRRTKDERRFALKVLHGQTGSDAMARFAREAHLASQIDHPNIVAVVDVDVTTDGTLFLVMEYIDGPSLESERARFGDAAWARPLLAQIATGLAAIHAKGIVHRDLKPANVLLAERADGGVPLAKITDFGISTLVHDLAWNKETLREGAIALDDTQAPGDQGSQSASLTRTGVVMGTPRYMAPEMFVGAKKARPASDVFSFGVIASELLTGLYPFPEGSVLALVQRMSTQPPPSIATLVPSLSEGIASCLDRCLSTDAARRPTAAEIVAALG